MLSDTQPIWAKIRTYNFLQCDQISYSQIKDQLHAASRKPTQVKFHVQLALI